MSRSRWFWLPGVVFAVFLAPLLSALLPGAVLGGYAGFDGGLVFGGCAIAAVLSYGVARWQLATPTESVMIACLGAAATFALVVMAWSGVG